MIKAILVLPIVGLLLGAGEPRPDTRAEKLPCVIAEEWAVANVTRLPTDLIGLTEYPMLYRKAIYRRLTHEQRVRAWDEHLARYSGVGSSLTTAQKHFVDSVRTLLPALLKQDTLVVNDDISPRAKTVLGFKIAKVLLTQLGEEETSVLDVSKVHSLGARARQHFGRVRAEASTRSAVSFASYVTSRLLPEGLTPPAVRKSVAIFGDCYCSVSSDWCDRPQGPTPTKCSSGLCTVGGPGGCGTFWLHTCDGYCVSKAVT